MHCCLWFRSVFRVRGPMAQALRLPFEYYIYYYYILTSVLKLFCISLLHMFTTSLYILIIIMKIMI